MAQELKVIADFYDLTLYLIGRIEKFPRHHRYSLGADMERRLQAIQALLIRARYAGGRSRRTGSIGPSAGRSRRRPIAIGSSITR
jgi:hypothetical protein